MDSIGAMILIVSLKFSMGALSQLLLKFNSLGMTLVSSPHLRSGWESSITLKSVVPLRGVPPTKTRGISLLYVYFCYRPQ